jgi:glutamate racemase
MAEKIKPSFSEDTGTGPIGVFDSGYGGLTVLKELQARLPGYDYVYLGDNARAPYGTRSFETVYHYTLECVQWLFRQDCPLVILACNTSSAKALRTIQQNDLPRIAPDRRVLGVIRPTTERIGNLTRSGKVGILATSGTVLSDSYPIEIAKFFPKLEVFQQACPMWVPLIENNEHDKPGADYFVKEYMDLLLSRAPGGMDAILLACTHYPLLKAKIAPLLPAGCRLIAQGEIVAGSLADYLQRHPEMETRCSKNGQLRCYTTDSTEDFDNHASIFYGQALRSEHVLLS